LLRFLFDEHVNARALPQLQAHGMDVVHVGDVGLSGAGDDVLFDWARRNGRIIVTRNYQDFVPLVVAAVERELSFPGVLFYPRSLSHADVGGHVKALEDWVERARARGGNPIRDSFGWLG